MKEWGDWTLQAYRGCRIKFRIQIQMKMTICVWFQCPWNFLNYTEEVLAQTKINWPSETSIIQNDGSLVRSASLAWWLSLQSQESTHVQVMSNILKPGLMNPPVELLLRSQTYLTYCYRLSSVWGNAHSIFFFCQIRPVTLFSGGRVIYCLPDVH